MLFCAPQRVAEVLIAIEWAHIGQPKFNDIVEALIHRLYDATATVEVVDGRGGDGGIDIKVTRGDHVTVYQLKYFPDGFPGNLKGRRTQIKKSFNRAMAHQPNAWVLVVPCNLTTSEKAFLDGLTGTRPVDVDTLTRAKLNEHLARHPGLVDYFERDQLYKYAVAYQLEKAALASATDLAERVSALGAIADSCDPNWTLDFAREGSMVVHRLRALHPRAHEVSPVRMDLEVGIGDPSLAERFRQSMEFGITDRLVLPPDAVPRLTVSGPDWLSATHEHVTVELSPDTRTPPPDATIELRFSDAAGNPLGSYEGVLTRADQGAVGRTLRIRFYDTTDVTLRLPFDPDAAVGCSVEGDVTGATPAEMARSVGLSLALASADGFEVYVDGEKFGTFTGTSATDQSPPGYVQELEDLRELAEDLDVVQRHCHSYFAVPDEVSAAERMRLRATRLLIEGHCVAHPDVREFGGRLTGPDSPELRAALSGEPRSMRFVTRDFTLPLGRRRLNLGAVMLFHTAVSVEQSAEALRALDAGQANGLRLRFRPSDGGLFHAVMPDKVADPRQPLVPVPLGLPKRDPVNQPGRRAEPGTLT